MSTYNGYESYDHWNTALWLNNDELLYNVMINEIEQVVYMQQSIQEACTNILLALPEKTPDDAEWQTDTLHDLVLENYNEIVQYS